MPRRGENIYKRKDGRWEGRYIKQYDIKGKAQYGYIYGKTYSAVKKLLAEKQIKNIKPEKIRTGSVYKDILVSWLESQRLNKKESTYAHYYQIIHAHLIPDIGFIKIEKMSTKLVEKYITQLLESGRIDGTGGLSAKTVSDILAIIKATIEYANYNDYLLQCNLDKVYIKQQNTEMRVLSIDEQQKLTLVLLEETDLTKFGVLLSLYTGIRIGEVCALKWENLNVVDGILSIKETMQRIKDTSSYSTSKTKIVITEPKSKCSIRDIPLPSFITSIAKGFQCRKDAYVLTGEKNRYIEPRTMQNRFKALIRESQINDANYHTLRHTFATRCIEVGFELKTLSEIMGHSNVNITLNRYVHSSLALKKENMSKISYDSLHSPSIK